MRVLSVANQKGGVGKTTMVAHLAHLAIEDGHRVLLVDMDRQGSLSLYFGAGPPRPEEGAPDETASLFGRDEGAPLSPAPLGRRYPGCSILRATTGLSEIQAQDSSLIQAPRQHLRALEHDYDLVIIDTPGHLGFHPPTTIAGLVASDAVVSPCAVGLFETRALAELWQYLRRIRDDGYNPRLRLLGLLPSKVNTRSQAESNGLEMLRSSFGQAILPFTLAERAAVKQALFDRAPVWRRPRGASHRRAAREWKGAMRHILTEIGL
ncbi:Cobyrinic acid ac-diamide synthase (plasmid) [Thioalkalivibrio sp. K90mix]|uniref:ParA family protein n=1 Tax=Thioalkalivibrio sp. (strain K90mix) TaxID=396595 RepID=UPI000195A94F|nr:ParA family protein [Thioalkalivibrio sp. K90mix]ADC73363.1 Cobyrinic acid ac-diamide synthase [Thioalkalivibrio sp. K90mix]